MRLDFRALLRETLETHRTADFNGDWISKEDNPKLYWVCVAILIIGLLVLGSGAIAVAIGVVVL